MKISKPLLVSLLITSIGVVSCKDLTPKEKKHTSEIEKDSIKKKQITIEEATGECCPGCGKG